jgi:WD repeat-containing protein 55
VSFVTLNRLNFGDRHPSSVDALCNIPESLPNVDTSSTILTGSSDGFMRAVEVFPTKLHGVVADHGDWPVERIAVGEGLSQLSLEDDDVDQDDDEHRSVKAGGKSSHNARVEKAESKSEAEEEEGAGGSGHWWAGSVGHDEFLKLTDLSLFFNKLAVDEENPDTRDDSDSDEGEVGREKVEAEDQDDVEKYADEVEGVAAPEKDDDDSEEEVVASRNKYPLAVKKKKGKNELEVEGTFFNDL